MIYNHTTKPARRFKLMMTQHGVARVAIVNELREYTILSANAYDAVQSIYN